MIVRASRLGDFMTEGRGKTANLGETAKTYIRELWIKEKFGREKVVMSKEMTKGNECEEKSISLFTSVTGELYTKNEATYIDDLKRLAGTPDILFGDKVIDIKTSWDLFTFMKAECSNNYYWQLQAYMYLTGKTRATLAYCLVDSPGELVSDEIKRLWYAFGMDDNNPEYIRKADQITLNHSFGDIPEADRVKTFEIYKDETFEEKFTAQYDAAYDYFLTLKLS